MWPQHPSEQPLDCRVKPDNDERRDESGKERQSPKDYGETPHPQHCHSGSEKRFGVAEVKAPVEL
jgi:hypothetical protein